MFQELWKAKEQRTLAPLSVPGASSAGSIRVVSGSGFRYVVPFPYRLHEMLSNVDAKHDSSIVSWLPDGKHFKVHDPRRFVEEVIPSAFKQKSLKSFQRQLHLYGFQRVHEGVDKGAYYHEKFRRDDRDMCLSITRTKAPKRSRVTPTIRKDTKDANVSQKLPSFQPLKKNTRVITSNTVTSLPQPNTEMSAVSISPTIFDQVSPQNNSSFLTENLSVKGPLHEAAVPSIISVDDTPRLSKPNQDSSSSDNASSPHQIKAHQQLEGSIADTCRWLINAGVPISAFDPVAIGDISHSTFSVPQVVPSTSPLNPLIPQQSTITQKAPVNACPSSETTTTVLAKNESQVPPFNTGIASTSGDINSLLSVAQPSQNSDLLSAPFQDIMATFDNDPLLTDLLPGENLPMVDDSLWAL